MSHGETSPATRATLEDVARVAGVSLATVDRVVNRRKGVRENTIARVEAAVARLGYRTDPAAARLARNQSFRFAFILPTGSNSFMVNLTEQVQRTADGSARPAGLSSMSSVSTCSIRTNWRSAGAVAAGLSRRCHDRARSPARPCRDRRSRPPATLFRGDVEVGRRVHAACIMSVSTTSAAGRTRRR